MTDDLARRIDVTEISGRAYAVGMTDLPYGTINALAEAIQNALRHGTRTYLEAEGRTVAVIGPA